MTMNLLRQLYETYAPTGCEWPMISLVRDFIATHVPQTHIDMDEWGNLYIIKGNEVGSYPTLCCHLDQAQKIHSNDFEVRVCDGILTGWSNERQAQEGIGADDKNGIWVCLRAFQLCDRLKVFMSVGEEKGCWGIITDDDLIPTYKANQCQ